MKSLKEILTESKGLLDAQAILDREIASIIKENEHMKTALQSMYEEAKSGRIHYSSTGMKPNCPPRWPPSVCIQIERLTSQALEK